VIALKFNFDYDNSNLDEDDKDNKEIALVVKKLQRVARK